MAELFLLGLLAHLVADWFLQSDTMAQKKVSLLSPWAWIHGGIHFGLLAIFWPALPALGVALSHILIDTRRPLIWWRKLYGIKQVEDDKDIWWNVTAMQVAFLQDQAAHIIVLIAVARWLTLS